jgi:hypothetical protein
LYIVPVLASCTPTNASAMTFPSPWLGAANHIVLGATADKDAKAMPPTLCACRIYTDVVSADCVVVGATVVNHHPKLVARNVVPLLHSLSTDEIPLRAFGNDYPNVVAHFSIPTGI